MGYTSSSFLDARQASGTLGNLEAERKVTVRKRRKWRGGGIRGVEEKKKSVRRGVAGDRGAVREKEKEQEKGSRG